jgi:hypothetical protein
MRSDRREVVFFRACTGPVSKASMHPASRMDVSVLFVIKGCKQFSRKFPEHIKAFGLIGKVPDVPDINKRLV